MRVEKLEEGHSSTRVDIGYELADFEPEPSLQRGGTIGRIRREGYT